MHPTGRHSETSSVFWGCSASIPNPPRQSTPSSSDPLQWWANARTMAQAHALETVQSQVAEFLSPTIWACSKLTPLSGGTANVVFLGLLKNELADGTREVVVKHGKDFIATDASRNVPLGRWPTNPPQLAINPTAASPSSVTRDLQPVLLASQTETTTSTQRRSSTKNASKPSPAWTPSRPPRRACAAFWAAGRSGAGLAGRAGRCGRWVWPGCLHG
jgi:hypothetical protein